MGFIQVLGDCVVCGRPFMFHPHHVPSVNVRGKREPVCKDCMERANAKRKAMGLHPHPIQPDAYGAMPESEWDDPDDEL